MRQDNLSFSCDPKLIHCVLQKYRGKERDTDREIGTERERERHTDRDIETERDNEKKRVTQRDGKRQRERENSEAERERQIER